MSYFDELKLLFNQETQQIPELSRFEIKGILGKGAFATVFSALDKVLKIQVAIKMVDKKLFKNKEQQDIIRQEAMMLQTLEHNNIVKILGFFETSLKFFIVMNQIDGVTLETHISNIKSTEVVSITIQILKALSYLHQRNIVHRDIKPENILISYSNSELKVTLIDFGLSASLNRIQNSMNGLMYQNCGTLLYQAPELIKKANYTRSVDIWALGIVVYQMLNQGQHPFYECNDTKTIYENKIKNSSLNLQFNHNKDINNFLKRTIAYLPEHRLTADQCLEHPWITGRGDISVPITLNEIIQCQVDKEQNITKYIKVILFLKYLILSSSCYKTPYRIEANKLIQTGSLTEHMSDLSTATINFKIRPLYIKSQTRLDKDEKNDSLSNSSRNTSDMFPDTIAQVNTPDNKKMFRKSTSMNPQEIMIKQLNQTQKKLVNFPNKETSPAIKTRILQNPQGTISSRLPHNDSWKKLQNTNQNSRLRITQRPNYQRNPTQL
ncbi:unnamed protein product [Paramecium pentaurelia]|uniref:Protein kinase domain-containing protein n=1 Tax=Paramecium pentaurelia TaxID=43138 RepID=A0A8S1YNQ9_9CILI|nr:unnamed protein product [Paramecium pentaurelia]